MWGAVTSVPACSTVPALPKTGESMMDMEDRDPLDIFRRALPESARMARTDGFVSNDVVDLATIIAAQGKLVALFAMLLERERIMKASDLGGMLGTIAAVTARESPAEGEVLAIWAAGVQDVAASL